MQLANIDNLKHLNPTRSIYAVLGTICKNPRALRDPEIHLTEKDFFQDLHKIIFFAINQMIYSGAEVKHITEVDVDNFLAPHADLYKVWHEGSGMDYLKKSIAHSNIDVFRYNYDLIKKYSLLRDCIENGIGIKDLFDFENVDMKIFNDGRKRVEAITLEEIVDHFSLKMTALRNEWSISSNAKNFIAGEDLDTLLEELNTIPEFGYPFQNGFYNAVFRGMRKGKFMLRSATTGGGKTRQALADMCTVSCAELYHYKTSSFVKISDVKPSLFISTELEKREVQTIMLAFVTGVPENIIKDGKYSEPIRKRLEYGIKLLKDSPIFCVYVDDFSIVDIESIIEEHIIQKGVEYVAFDYIQMTPKLSRTMSNAFKTTLREDQILVQFSAAMKLLANKYQIFLESSTQLNRQHKDDNQKDTNSLRGGSATADKVDHGILSFKVTAKDLENVAELIENGFKKPNFSHWVYKNRSGRTGLIIWTEMDLGTMREEMCFITDTDFNLIDDIKSLDILMTEAAGFGDELVKVPLNPPLVDPVEIGKSDEEIEEDLDF